MKHLFISLFCLFICVFIQAQIKVIAHRGDWRNEPENSLPAIKSCIGMGVDMVEIDLKRTKDGHLVLMHDWTIDRTSTGKGKPEEYDLSELSQFRLKSGVGHATMYSIPTLDEVLPLIKGKIMVNIDKGYDYFAQVYELLQKAKITSQVVIKTRLPYSKVKEENGDILTKVKFMPIINIDEEGATEFIQSYLSNMSPYAFECDFKIATPQVLSILKLLREKKQRIWINSLWPELCGGHDDERAVGLGEKEESWGWIIRQGASFIQTDRPALLIEFLKKHGLHK